MADARAGSEVSWPAAVFGSVCVVCLTWFVVEALRAIRSLF